MCEVTCKNCGGAMIPGKVVLQTRVGASGALIDCLECKKCGWKQRTKLERRDKRSETKCVTT